MLGFYLTVISKKESRVEQTPKKVCSTKKKVKWKAIQNKVNNLDPMSKSNSDNSTNKRDYSLKSKTIRSININGLANNDKFWTLYHYFIATQTDILFIQEVRKLKNLENVPKLRRAFILVRIHKRINQHSSCNTKSKTIWNNWQTGELTIKNSWTERYSRWWESSHNKYLHQSNF